MADEFRMVRLGDLLPSGVIEEVFRDMNDRLERGQSLGDVQKAVVVTLEPRRKELEDKGVLAEYLAWFLVMRASEDPEGAADIAFTPTRN